MTRKRFVKLLISYGIKRNVANKTAHTARYCNMSYRKFFGEIVTPVVEDRA